jgi:hypothetical protein
VGVADSDTSRNGIIIHPWGLATIRATAASRLRWPPIGGAGSTRGATTAVQTDPPRPLTGAEKETFDTVFESTLAWPPLLVPGDPLQLKQAGRKPENQRLSGQGQT